MKREVAEAWVKDLRTNPPKTTTVLYDGTGYCCLGRLAMVLGCAPNDEIMEAYLSQDLMDLSGMRTSCGTLPNDDSLAEMNDAGSTFAEIADVIEKYWEAL